ncbi:ParB N-terminal domain-containing protein [Erwinia psidii]|nr:ParB N-terminal domain-containing protein [Erwinia psidii]
MNVNAMIRIIDEMLSRVSLEQKIEIINTIKSTISKHSPFGHHPVDCIQWVKMGDIRTNDYNPNTMPPAEEKLLHLSILRSGYTKPLLVRKEKNGHVIIDGVCRFNIAMRSAELQQLNFGYFPVAQLNEPHYSSQDMATAIRHNRARGKHCIKGMINIVASLTESGWSIDKISHELGMEHDEVLRLKQISGLYNLFAEEEYSEAWTVT